MANRNSRDAAVWAVAVVALLAALYADFAPRATSPGLVQSATLQSELLSSLDRDGTIKAGYGVYPPFTDEDPATGKVSGISVDIINEIARQAGLKVTWSRFNWNTMSADLKRGQYDVLADAIFETPDRAREFTFTNAYAYLPIGIAVVKKGDARFKVFDDINSPSVKVAVGQGFAEETFVKARAPRATIISIPSGQDSAMPINSVLTGRADIAITNLANADRYVKAHPDTLQVLWADHPPAYVPVAFALNLGDRLGADFLSVSLANLKSTGVLAAIAKKNGATVALDNPLAAN